ncbi:hypothetical protein [Tardiphaga sp.]|jgi:hypothetical protein|uniref:hypothetical protein n=1 Tax=Tardiphaga sp. TaxID=1926292 RepID=UPI0037DA01D6
MDDGFATAVRQAALALAYDLSETLDAELGDNTIGWAAMPSVARIRELYPDATLEEASTASEACRAGAVWAETSALILRFGAPSPIPHDGEKP